MNTQITIDSFFGSKIVAIFDGGVVENVPEKELSKGIEDCKKYGYRGCSLGGKNGVFNITKKDNKMYKSFQSDLKKGKVHRLFKKIFDYDAGAKDLIGVKVVAHRRSTERIAGAMDTKQKKIIFYGIKSYV